jgi:hypothetical protein
MYFLKQGRVTSQGSLTLVDFYQMPAEGEKRVKRVLDYTRHPSRSLCFPWLVPGCTYPRPPNQHVIMNSVLSLTGAAHRHHRKDPAAEIRAGQR